MMQITQSYYDRQVVVVKIVEDTRPDDHLSIATLQFRAYPAAESQQRIPAEETSIRLTMDQLMYMHTKVDAVIHAHVHGQGLHEV